MKELIGVAILIASLFGGAKVVGFIHNEVRKAALTKAAQGLPELRGNFRQKLLGK